MKPFKVGGYYTVLDRTAFFSTGYVLEVEEGGRLPTGTVFKLKKGYYKSEVTAITSDGHKLYGDLCERHKFKPATNKQISQYKKEWRNQNERINRKSRTVGD